MTVYPLLATLASTQLGLRNIKSDRVSKLNNKKNEMFKTAFSEKSNVTIFENRCVAFA